MAANEGLILGRLLCQRGRRALKPPDCLGQSFSSRTLAGWRQSHQSASGDSLSPESLHNVSTLGAAKEDEAEETGFEPLSDTRAFWPASQLLYNCSTSTATPLDLPYTVRWPSPKLASSWPARSNSAQCFHTNQGLLRRPSTNRSVSGSLNSIHWLSTKPDTSGAVAEFQGAVAEALKPEHGERLQKESSASEAAACDEAVNTLSEAQKKAKQKEATKKDRTLTQQAIATIIGIPSALRAVFAMSGADWVRTFKGWGVAIKETAQHYWVGTKLLWADVRVASRLLLKVANGKSLSRRERKQLTRTVADVFRLVPFAIFVIVPFMEFLLPVFLRFFPNMLPSTFQDKMKEEELMKKKLQARLQYARFLQETVGEMAREVKSTSTGDKKKTAEDLVAFMQKVRTGRHVSNDDIVNFAKLFNDELTLDNISRPRLVSMCKYMGLSPFGTDAYLRYQLRARLNWIKEDDKLIQREGVDSLTEKELRSACRQRGMLMVDNMSEDEMRTEIREWLDLSLNRSLPSSLLILSRVITRSLDDAIVQSKLPTILLPPPDGSSNAPSTAGSPDGIADARSSSLWSPQTAPSQLTAQTAFVLPIPTELPLLFSQPFLFPGGPTLAVPAFAHGAHFSSMPRHRNRNSTAAQWDLRMAKTALSMGPQALGRAQFLARRGSQSAHSAWDPAVRPLPSQSSIETSPLKSFDSKQAPSPELVTALVPFHPPAVVETTQAVGSDRGIAIVPFRSPPAQEIIRRVLRQLSYEKRVTAPSAQSSALVPYANRPALLSDLIMSRNLVTPGVSNSGVSSSSTSLNPQTSALTVFGSRGSSAHPQASGEPFDATTVLLPHGDTWHEDIGQVSFEAALSGMPFRPSGLRMSRSKLAEMWNAD